MSAICPTILAFDKESFELQMIRIRPFAERIQIDLMDGVFAPTKSVSLDEISWPADLVVDIHMMYQRPLEYVPQLIALRPHLVILHVESEAVAEAITALREGGIRVGLALLADTPTDALAPYLDKIEHVLIFSGNLGRFGGTVDLSLLRKIDELRTRKPMLEIGWDGGVNESVAGELSRGGVDVLNVGGAIQQADDPLKAYATLVATVNRI